MTAGLAIQAAVAVTLAVLATLMVIEYRRTAEKDGIPGKSRRKLQLMSAAIYILVAAYVLFGELLTYTHE